ncbi:MAG: DinB family protein [Thermoguttaceae bacterium]
METKTLIDNYLDGPQLLRKAVAGMSQEQLVARPIPRKWSTLEVICHLADFEIVYADRIKRVIAENDPTLFGGDPDGFAARLAYHQRNAEEELLLIEAIRKQVARILRTVKLDDFQRRGIHSESGPLTLETLVQRITGHIPHHVRFIEEKRKAMAEDRR